MTVVLTKTTYRREIQKSLTLWISSLSWALWTSLTLRRMALPWSSAFLSQDCKQHKDHIKQTKINCLLFWKIRRHHFCTWQKKEIGHVCIAAAFDPVYNNIAYGIAVRGQLRKLTWMKLLLLRALHYMHFAPYRSHAIPLFNLYNILPLNFQYCKSVCTTSSWHYSSL